MTLLVAGALVLFTIISNVGSLRPLMLRNTLGRLAVPLLLFLLLVTLTTFSRDLPTTRYQLYFGFLIGTLGFFVVESRSPGRFIWLVYIAAVGHLVLAVVSGARSEQFGTGMRLTGGFTPVFLGFEAVMVLLLTYVFFSQRNPLRIIASVSIIVLATYVLYESFSRAALISLFAGCAVAIVVSRLRNGRAVGVAVGVALVIMLCYFYGEWIWVFLQSDADGLVDASGRIDIWKRIYDSHPDPWRGYGFAALRDSSGPDSSIFAATSGLPAENALLQSYLVAGASGVVLWMWIALVGFRVLWLGRYATSGWSLALGVALLVNIIYSVGMSGQTVQWWWLLGAIALVSHLYDKRIGRFGSVQECREGVEDLELCSMRKGSR